MESKAGWRAAPASALIGAVGAAVYLLARIVILYAMPITRGFSPTLSLTGEAFSFATALLILVGTIELAGRATPAVQSMLKLAIAGAALPFVADILTGFVNFTKEPYEHRWVYDAYAYASTAGGLMLAVGLTLSRPAPRRALGYATIVLTLLTWLPTPVHEAMYSALPLKGRELMTVELLVRVARFVLLALLFIQVSEGSTTSSQPARAARGLQLAAQGLWLRVIAAVIVVLFTLLMITSKGPSNSSVFKLLMVTQSLVSTIALVMTGLGALNAARAGVRDLDAYALVLGGGGSLWAAGVSLAQMPHIYMVMYGGQDYGGPQMTEWLAALSLALPIIVIVGVGLLATALSGFAARRGDEDLRSDAQGKGIGYVVLLLVSVAIQAWMLPRASSVGSFAMLSILAAIASLWGTVMIARLLGRGAQAFEMEPGLPQASIVSSGSPTAGS